METACRAGIVVGTRPCVVKKKQELGGGGENVKNSLMYIDKNFPERSGGTIIVCNKCRVTKNYFWKP